MIDKKNKEKTVELDRKPAWIRQILPMGQVYNHTAALIKENSLNTICESAKCPNRGECWGAGTATIMILGNICTRACGFCSVKTGRPLKLDNEEPGRAAEAVLRMNLNHVVITSVNRDDLEDGGAELWSETIKKIRSAVPNIRIEVLLPDFCGNWKALETVMEAAPDILGHNLETVPGLYFKVRPQADYERSLEFLWRASNRGFMTKTGIMVGHGETRNEIEQLIRDCIGAGVRLMTIGQYLRPTLHHLPVERWILPEEFKEIRSFALGEGIKKMESGPLVRSSYHAEKMTEN